MTQKFKQFIDLHYKDYDSLKEIGAKIKQKEYLESEEFSNYKQTINSLIKRPLKDSQIQSAIHLIEMGSSLNFSVPGSGKTATVLGAFEYLANYSTLNPKSVEKLLVIGPKNCAKAWKDEYKLVSFESNNHPPLCLINDDSNDLKNEVLRHDFKTSRLIIVNYELIPKLNDTLLELVNSKIMIVFDEIHRIKKIDSEKIKCLKKITFNTRYRIALTGTPLPNGYIDLYNMMLLLHDDYTHTFFRMYESSLKADDARYRKTGIQNSDFNKLINPFMMRVDKKDLNVPLPEPDELIFVQTNQYERELYNKIIDAKYDTFERNIKLIEIGCVPFKCDQSIEHLNEITFDNTESYYLTSKICAFLSKLKNNNRKTIVWCNFVDTINIIYKILKENGYYVKKIYGTTEQDEREKIIDEFNNGTLQVLVTNPATLAESVSLHKSCHDAHYLELNYNLYQYLQSRDRIHRLGLKPEDKTKYYLYFNFYDDEMKISKDYDIYKALKNKEKLMEESIRKGNFILGETDEMEFN